MGYAQIAVLAIDRCLLDVQATVTDDSAVCRTDGDASVTLWLSRPAAWTHTPNRREHNLIVRSGKSEADVTNNKRRRSKY